MTPTQESRKDPLRTPRGPFESELALRIEHHIEGKAHGRIRDLHVVCTENLIILQGRTRSQHAKQVAQEAVFDVADSRSLLANQIVVTC